MPNIIVLEAKHYKRVSDAETELVDRICQTDTKILAIQMKFGPLWRFEITVSDDVEEFAVLARLLFDDVKVSVV